MTMVTATALMNPDNSGRERTLSRNPKRNTPIANRNTPACYKQERLAVNNTDRRACFTSE
jgi:hypothetical protein